jgi:MYXO-CTERM domain-containing protein
LSRRARWALLPCLLLGCGAPERVDEAASPIIGGTVTTGDPAVVMLVSYPADLSTFDSCTAALIAPDVLVTAAHCVDAKDHPGYLFGAFTGPDATAYATADVLVPQLVPAKAAHAHPDYDPSPPYHADIAVVVLEKALTTPPLPVNRAPLDMSTVGEAARIVGYGQTVYGTYNAIKHQASTVVDSLGADDTVAVGDTTHRSCVGDSGGPALVKAFGVETVIGVDSYTELAGCLEPANYRRTDAYLPFLDTYVPPPAVVDAGADGGEGGDAGTAEPPASGGCAVGGGSSGAGGGAALVALALVLARRKRR